MYRLTSAEMADMHFVYGSAAGNVRLAATLYQERYPNRDVSDHRLLIRLHLSLSENESFLVPNANAGRARDLNLNREDVLKLFRQNPRASTHAAAVAMGLRGHTAVWRVLNRNNYHPYRFQRGQDLLSDMFLENNLPGGF